MGINLCVGHNPEFKVNTNEWIPSHPTRLLLSRNVAPPVALPLDTVACGDVLSAEAVLSSPWSIANCLIASTPNIIVNPGSFYSLSMYVHRPAAGNWTHGVRLAIKWFTAADVFISLATSVLVTVPNASFERMVYENRPSPATAGKAYVAIDWDTDALGNHLYFTAVQFEEGPVATDYNNGLQPTFPPRFW